MRLHRLALPTPLALLPLALLLAACGEDAAPEAAPVPDDAVGVVATDTTCELATTDLPSGATTFAVRNDGTVPTELYVYGPGGTVVAEAAGIGPGEERALTVELTEGAYDVACTPDTGDAVSVPVRASGDGGAVEDPRLAAGVESFTSWVRAEVDDLVVVTQAFTDAVVAGDVEAAKELYPDSRVPWERIEPVAESFGDIDPRVDVREDGLEPGQEFTGWHRLEQLLWVEGRTDPAMAERLLADVRELQTRVATVELTASQVGNGAKELLDEVATGKVTGEEERYSHTDLVDFAANVEGARAAFEALRPVAADREPALVEVLEQRFDDVESALAPYGSGADFALYTSLTQEQVVELARVVDALSEPLSALTAAVVR